MNSKEIVAKMTLEEKASLCSGKDFWNMKGIERLGLPSVMLTDGPHGLRKQAGDADHLGLNDSVPSTCFPPACTTACSFDTGLMHEIGQALGEECRQEQVAVILGPGANIKRSPLCGRNFEYISEDPYVSGKLASALIQGVQSKNVGTSLKHFAANNQEKKRMTNNSVIDERALREIYLAGFETAVREAQPWTVMCSYNRINGTYASEDKWLLTDVLRDEWGFEGLVVTDWGATNDRVEGVRAGLDLEMPASGGFNDAAIVEAVRTGALSEQALDKVVERVVSLILKAKEGAQAGFCYNMAAHHALARRAAAESSVLLKNENHALPLQAGQSVAVIGAFAKTPRYQGAGSSKINPSQLDNALEELLKQGFAAEYAPGYSLEPGAKADAAMIDEAAALAKTKDTAVVFVGLPDEYESEGFDRTNLEMPESHTKLVEAVAAANPNTVVVLLLGAPVVTPWANKVKAILVSYLGGQAAGSACADVLAGKTNPSGKLAESWPAALADTPCAEWYPGADKTAEYRESIFVGYRYYDTAGVAPAWPFGFGLSYTSFAYNDITVSGGSFAPGGSLQVSATVTNTGRRAGGEAVQLYIAAGKSKLMRPAKELKGMAKVFLQPGESKTISIELDTRSFAYYNAAEACWAVEGGTYTIMLGAASNDIRLTAEVLVEGDGKENKLAGLAATAPAYFNPKAPLQISEQEFAALYGKPLPPAHRLPGQLFDRNSTLGEIKDTFAGRQLIKNVRKQASGMMGEGSADFAAMLEAMLMDMPLRSLVMMSGGMINPRQLDGMVDMVNGKFFKGLGRLLSKK